MRGRSRNILPHSGKMSEYSRQCLLNRLSINGFPPHGVEVILREERGSSHPWKESVGIDGAESCCSPTSAASLRCSAHPDRLGLRASMPISSQMLCGGGRTGEDKAEGYAVRKPILQKDAELSGSDRFGRHRPHPDHQAGGLQDGPRHLQGPVPGVKKKEDSKTAYHRLRLALALIEMSENMRDFLDFAAACMEGRFGLTILE